MFKKWNSLSLIVRICIGLVIGAILGLAVSGWSWIAVLGKLFVGALKANYIGILFWAVIFGTALKAAGAGTKKTLEDLADARTLVKSGDFDAVKLLYEDVPDTLSQLIRTAFIPKDGTQLYVSDFSAIEARVID